jgi:protein-S-isoprenylcysteine O-methyltransferase Ste14
MNAVALEIWVSAFSSFGWGMLRFFRKPAGLHGRTALVAALGALFSGWHLFAIASSSPTPLRQLAAIGCLSFATTLFWSAVCACGSHALTAIFADDLPVHLVRGGPYRYIRHPFYTSYTIFWFAGWIASGSLLALVSAVMMLGLYLDAAGREERKFAGSPLRAEYEAYRRRTGLMTPRLRRRAATGVAEAGYCPVTPFNLPRS